MKENELLKKKLVETQTDLEKLRDRSAQLEKRVKELEPKPRPL